VIVGKSTAASGFHAFRWTQASNQLSDLGTLSNNNFGSWANGVSGDGLAVVGGSNSSPGNQAYRWTAGSGMVGLGDLTGGDFESEAWGASTNGSVVVGQSTSANGINEAFRWTQATGMVGLGDLDGGIFSSVARAVSGDGSIVIGYGTPVSRHIAFIWDATNHMRNLQDVLTNEYGLGPSLAGWQLNEASTISEDGKFLAGYGTDPAGNTEAWVVNLAASTSIPGDYNLNGVVDAADYTIWRDTLGSTTDLRANGDDTGGSASVIDQADYAFWQSHFGNSGSGSKAITAVPEPGTLLMLLLGTLPIGFRRRAKVS
jgi:probable HAF family extracellular repeat protein